MAVKITELLNSLEKIAPFELAESWDNVGLLIGDPERESCSVLLGLDPTLSLLEEAVSRGADTIITHHPCIFRPLSFVHTSSPDGAFLEFALAKKINVIACHTNFDSASPGVSDALAILLGLIDLSPLRRITSTENSDHGLGRIGSYASPLPFKEFMQQVLAALDLKNVMFAGKPPEVVQTVALCGGSGSDLVEEAFSQGADVYLSAEIKHSAARWAKEVGFCVIDGTHYATERPAIALLEKQIVAQALAADWDLQILQSESEKSVFNSFYKDDFK
ncbi:MAG TPA: Nif3-like dinuclear metal center hexameric protein [Desulfobacterales bacterium]|nr:Nif3-like dinuclear metal center hexameric protein [Desulfobacterales bacterium]